MEQQEKQALAREALAARTRAYAPYSQYQVGAALLGTNGTIYLGCNIENSSYGATNCAERTAFFKAVSEGCLTFKGIAIAGGSVGEEDELSEYAYPCGICRQVMTEFCKEDFEILVVKTVDEFETYTLGQLLPSSFTGDKLG